jgi:hypothetical protein
VATVVNQVERQARHTVAVPVTDRIVTTPAGDEYVVEAWRASEAFGVAPSLGFLLELVMPW